MSTTTPSFDPLIGGNVAVTNSSGNVSEYDGIWDTEVLGNVTFNHGPGEFMTQFRRT